MDLHPGHKGHHVVEASRIELDPIQRALQENEDWYQDLVEHSHDLLCIHDLTGRLLSVNPAPARVLGYSVEELLQIPMRELVVPEFRSEFDAYMIEIERVGEAHGLLAMQTRSGGRRIWQYHNTLRREGVASPIVRGMAHDVTEQRQKEKLLRQAGEDLLSEAFKNESIIRELKLFRTLVDHSNDAIKVVDPETLRFLDVNQKACTALGYSREELLALTVFDIDAKVTRSMAAGIREQLRKLGSVTIESLHRRKDGSVFPVEVSMKWVQLEREYVVAVAHDLTTRKEAEGRIRASENRYRAVHDRSPAGICWIESASGRFLRVNPKYCEIVGRTEADLLERDFRSITHPDDLVENCRMLQRLLNGELQHYRMEKRYIRPDGEIRWADVSIVAMIEGDKPVWNMAIVDDITERKQAEEALRESELRFRAVYERSPVGIALVDPRSGRFLQANAKFCEIAGRSEAELLGIDVGGLTHPDDVEQTTEYLRQLAQEELTSYAMDKRYLRPDGSVRWVRVLAVSMWDKGETHRWHMGLVEDITEQKQAEEALKESEEKFSKAFRRSPMAVTITSIKDHRYIEVNETFERASGWRRDEIIGRTPFDIDIWVHPEERMDLIKRLLTEGSVRDVETSTRRRDGSIRTILHTAEGIELNGESCMITVAVDITQRKQAEQALRESEARERAKSRELETVLDAVPVAVFLARDPDCKYITTNRTGYEQLRLPGGANISKSALPPGQLGFRILRDGIEVPTEELPMQQAAATAQPIYKVPFLLRFGDGSERQELFNSVPLLGEDGRPTGVVGASIDVTESKRAEEALRQTVARLQLVTEELSLAKERVSEEKLYLEQSIDTELGFGEIIGRSSALKEVMEKVAKVAPSDATVLLLGETGTGKELVARAIHRMSKRQDSSFIKLNCAAIPSGLLESELFGHEKGAFTGAIAKKLGRLELADEGTLFLDEIGDIPLELQPKLLRVLQDQEFERLGGTQTLKVNFRLVAATNRDLLRSVNQREFRSDLYYRLNVFPIRTPPLRERRDDIPLLIEHFVRKYAGRMNKSILTIPAKTMETLVQWAWPGNIRELENFVERSVILTPGLVLQVPLGELHPVPDKNEGETLREKERDRILRALRECNGQLGGPNGAAARLGLKRTTLQSKLTQFGINPGGYRN
jgi:formate hydrogenlyase transcriptional activator